MYIEAPNEVLPSYYIDNVKIEGELPAVPIEIEQGIINKYLIFLEHTRSQ